MHVYATNDAIWMILMLFMAHQTCAVKDVVWAGTPIKSTEEYNAVLAEQLHHNDNEAPYIVGYDFNCHMNWRQAEDPSLYVTKPPCENDKVYMITDDDTSGSRR